MTTEEKAKAYDKVIEKIKYVMKHDVQLVLNKEDLQDIFPELAESKDERIRNVIRGWIYTQPTSFFDSGISKEEMFAWLESKEEQYNNEDLNILQRFSFYSYKDEPNILYLSGLYVNEKCRNKGIGTKILEVADEVAKSLNCHAIRLKTEIGSNAERLYRRNQYHTLKREGNQVWLEKQGESIKIKKGKNYLCTKTHKYAGVEWIEGVKYYSPEDYSLVNQGCTCYCPKYSEEDHNNLFEEVKYDGCVENKMSTNKVKPKYKVGDWIVNKLGDSWHIDSFDKKNYQVSDGKGNYNYFSISKQDEMHLWTIQDAKKGDVLVHNDCTFIFMGIEKGIVKGLCPELCNSISNFGEPEYDNDYQPATKEQRGHLFEKIHKAGYEWDVENNLLKSNLTEFEDAVKDMMNTYRDAIGANDITTEEVKKHAAYLLSLIPYKPAKWSKEDEENFNDIDILLFEDKNMPKEKYWKMINWIKSLKQRIEK